MADESDPRRDALHEFMQQQGPPPSNKLPAEGAAILTGWTMVAEWMDGAGERWLARGWSPSTSPWSAKGMLHEALYGDWPAGRDVD